jgi:tRNA nucleotidyltransferase/poly(A) polymerase
VNSVRKSIFKILKESLLSENETIRVKFNIPIPKDVIHIKNLLKEKGHKLYVVGGAVRDAYLGKEPKDYDLATDALPDVVQEILTPYYKTLETGKAFGIINVLTPSGEYEIATFRKDVGSGRRPDSVEFTTIDQDVKRRDLTINALFYDIDASEIVDLVGGLEDLKRGIVRTVGSAEDRFAEDRLRIMRAIRFAGRFGSELDPAVDAALMKDSNLEGVSGERIRDEFIKGIKSSKSVVHFLGLLEKYNLFQWIFGKLNYTNNFIEEKDVPVLMAYLLQDNNVDSVKTELNKLKYTVDEISQITFLLNFKNFSPEKVFKLKRMQANSKLSNEQIMKFAHWSKMNLKLVDAFLKFKLSVTGQELMQQGFKGKSLGDEIEKRETQIFMDSLK